MKKTVLLFMQIFLLFVAVAFPLSAQTRPRPPFMPGMNFNGRKMPPRSENFSVIGLKVKDTDYFLTISIFFNDAVDSNSVKAKHIMINGMPVREETEFLFSRNRHMVRFSIPMMREPFSLTLTNIHSFDGRIINPTEIPGLEPNSFCKFSRQERTWQRFSL